MIKSKLKIIFNFGKIINAQQWLKQNYPDPETETIYLNHQLVGTLDCREYKNLWNIYISSAVDSSKLEIKKGSYKGMYETYETKITPCLPAQTYLDQNYPSNGTCQIECERHNINNFGKTREEITNLDISEKDLEGNCNLSDFKNCEEIYCYKNYLTNLKVNNCQKLGAIWCLNNQLTTLNLSNLAELEVLYFPDNYLMQIPAFPYPKKITLLDISNNNLNSSNLTIFRQLRNLRELRIGNSDKNKINQNIYNHFTGSCEPLKDLNKLEELHISNTDLDSGWEYLPDSLWRIDYDTTLRPNCKLAQTKTELEKEIWADIHQNFAPLYKKAWLDQGFNKEQTKEFLEEWNPVGVRPQDGAFINWFLNFKKLDLTWACENEEEFKDLRDKYSSFGTCPECQQPNTSRYWCHSCNAKHFQKEFNTWTSGNPNIDKFIQQCQCEATSPWNVLEWIPADKFRNIEPLAEGGFGKVEKAKWEGGSIEWWNSWRGKWERSMDWQKDYKTVALKTLFNSQNLSQDFLAELTLYKRFKSEVSQMVPCYGVSKDPASNYILVMKYMAAGNLREYLRKNYRNLKFYDKYRGNSKLNFLQQISQGLKDIHRKKLMHCDFHSGNIVVDKGSCRITDLGLSKPVNEAQTEDKVHGLMPYMAPEVLMGQSYTQKSDIYSLGMIMYEILTCLPPYAEYAHDTALTLRICEGLRPQFPSQVKYPQLLVDLIKQCWEPEPNNRPSAREVSEVVKEWFEENGRRLKTDTEFYHQFQEAEAFNKTLPDEIKYPTYYSLEVWHSKPINKQQITHLLESHNLTLPVSLLTTSNNSSLSTRQFKRQLSLSAESSSSKTVRYQEPTEFMEVNKNEQLQAQIQIPLKQ